MKNKRPLVPSFINKLDKYLLLNKPDTWSARAHLVLYYNLLFGIVLTAVCFLMPDDPRNGSNIIIWSFFVAIVAAIGFIVWLIFLLRFNVFKRFGIVTAGDKIKTFFLYFIAIGSLSAIIYIPAVIETIKANRAYGNEEIVQDVNTLNLAICRLNYDSVPHVWDADTLLVTNRHEAIVYNDEGQVMTPGHGKDFHVVDTVDFRNRKNYADSMVTINDSMIVIFKCPDYNFVHAQGSGLYANTRILSSSDIFARVFKKPGVTDKTALEKELRPLLLKYNADTSQNELIEAQAQSTVEVESDDLEEQYLPHIKTKYGLYKVNISLSNITDRKYRWSDRALVVAIRVIYYTTIFLTLLVFIFRHSTIKTFFLTLLAAIVLLMLTSLFLVMIRTVGTAVFVCCIVYYLAFLLLACMVGYTKTRNVVTGIALNLMVFFSVFVPFLLVSFYYQLLREADQFKDYDERDFVKYEQEDLHYLYAEILGFVLLLVLIETVFKKLYRKWYALPEA